MSAFYEISARYYDAETSSKVDDLMLYSQLAQQYGEPILDVGCGTGRVLLHLGQEGYRIHGVDDSTQMLARLEHKLTALPSLRETISYTKSDIFTFHSDEQYKLTLLTYNALMHFHDQEAQIKLLNHLHSLTHADGLLVIDLPNAGETFATQDSDSIIHDRSFIEPEQGHLVMLQSTSYLDRTTQLLQVNWIYDEIQSDNTVKRLIIPHVLRYYFYAEIRLLLQLTHFKIVGVFGDTDESPFEDGSERMIIYAQPMV